MDTLTLTLLFTDVEGSTVLQQRLGEARAQAALARHEDILRRVIAEHGGRVLKSLGDGLMATFKSARSGVRAGVDMVAAIDDAALGDPAHPVRIRVGIHCGEVGERDDDVVGRAVHAASRICACAEGGEVLASLAARLVADDIPGIEFRPLGTKILKGFDEPWTLFAATPLAPDKPGQARLVGRHDERRELSAVLDGLDQGRGQVVFVSGEAGVGKSRLASNLADAAEQRGHLVLRARCDPRTIAEPFGPWVQMLATAADLVEPETLREVLGEEAGEVARLAPQLRRRFPDIPAPLALPPEQERRFLFAGVEAMLKRSAAHAALVLFIDDLHWVDQSSLLLLEHLAPLTARQPICIIATLRPFEEGSADLREMASRCARSGWSTTLALDAFDSATVRALLAALLGDEPPEDLVDVVYRRTDGNAFYVEEVMRTVLESGSRELMERAVDALPSTVKLTIEARLAHLPSGDRTVIEAAAIVAGAADPKILSVMVAADPGSTVEAVLRLQEAGLLRALVDDTARTQVLFRHSLVRDAVLDGLPALRQCQLHLRAADALEGLLGRADFDTVTLVAHHLNGAGDLADTDRTVSALRAAGDQAVQAAAFDDARVAYDAGLRRLGGDGHDEQRARILRGLGYVVRSTGSFEEAYSVWRLAIEEFSAVGDEFAAAELAVELISVAAWAGKFGEGFELTELALASDESLSARGRVQLRAFRGQVLAILPDFAEADRVLAEARALAVDAGDEVGLAMVEAARASRWNIELNPDEASGAAAHAVELLRDAGRPWELADALGWLAISRLVAGDFAGALLVHEELGPLADTFGVAGAMMLDRWVGTVTARCRGDFDEARRLCRVGIDALEAAHLPWVTLGLQLLARLELTVGDLDEAERCARESLDRDFPSGFSNVAYQTLLPVLAYRRDEAGRRSLSDELMPRVEGLTGIGMTNGEGSMLEGLTESALLAGDIDRLAALPEALLVFREHGQVVVGWDGDILVLRPAVVRAARGDWDGASELFALAEHDAAALGSPPAVAELDAWTGWAWLLRGGPWVGEGRRLLNRASSRYQSLRMPLHAEWCRQLASEGQR